MNRYLKAVIVVVLSAVVLFFLARAYFGSQMSFTPGGIARYDAVLRSAHEALIMAKALDWTLVYLIAALIGGLWWASRPRDDFKQYY